MNPFNHCVMLLYYGKGFNLSNHHSSLGYHTDVSWSKDEHFVKGRNMQKKNTFTVVYNIGDDRILHFREMTLHTHTSELIRMGHVGNLIWSTIVFLCCTQMMNFQ